MLKKLFLIFPLVITSYAFAQEADTASEVEEDCCQAHKLKVQKLLAHFLSL